MYYIRDMRTLAERLTWARAQKGLTQEELAKLAGVSQGTIGNLESGIRQTARKIVNIATAVGVDPLWLSDGKGDPSAADQLPAMDLSRVAGMMAVDAYNHGVNPNVVQVPKVELRVSAGITGFSVDGSDDVNLDTYPLDRRWVERNNYSSSKLLAMYVKGDSMYPLYREGDIIVVNTADTKMVDTKEYVFNFDGDVVLKTLTRERGAWWLTSVNPEAKYHQRSVRSGETFIIGRVVKHDRLL